MTSRDTVERIRRLVDWMGGTDGGFTHTDYADKYPDYDPEGVAGRMPCVRA